MSAPSERELLDEPLVAAVDVMDVADDGLTVGDERREHERGTSTQVRALHRAPQRAVATPLTSAWCPSMRMSAPMRESSSANMNRFSKTFSVMMLLPSAIAISAMNCACMSVGKPGIR